VNLLLLEVGVFPLELCLDFGDFDLLGELPVFGFPGVTTLAFGVFTDGDFFLGDFFLGVFIDWDA